MILGFTGKNSCGKGEAVAYLQKLGFKPYSLSDILREELQASGKPITRENLIALGTAMRTQHGNGVLAQKTLSKLDADKNYVIDSIRHPDEVKVLQQSSEFVLVHIHASPKIRFERMKIRARESDPKTLEEFENLEKREAKAEHSSGQQLEATIAMTQLTLENDLSLEVFHEQIKDLVLALSHQKKRPDWDEYFMNIAKSVALRSNCIKRKVAAVLVKDKRIIATGYNGTPRGVKNCNEGGCPRCNAMTASGAKLDECLCSHAEENAIVQSAYHGVRIQDCILYTTFSPCLNCSKMIINAGVKEVVFQNEYSVSDIAANLLKEAGVAMRKIS